MTDNDLRLANLFLPHAMARIAAAKSKPNFRFAYYTSASTGMKILDNNEAWLRNASLMNDFSEVHHGQNCIFNAWEHTEAGTKLKALLTLLHPGAVDQFSKKFNDDQPSRTTQSYILCMSEHGDDNADEDQYGRLSMWRAYGGDTNVAFILKSTPFFSETAAIDAYTSPVIYKDISSFEEPFSEFVDGLDKDLNFLREVGWETIQLWLFQAMRFSVLSTKHPGFLEEKEWRIIFDPARNNKDRIKPDIVTLDGIPQKIVKLPFTNYPEDGLFGIEIPEILDKIIVGPTQFPFEIRTSFVEKLLKLGVENAQERVVVSGIPLRRK